MSTPCKNRKPFFSRGGGWCTPFSISLIFLTFLLVAFGWQTIALLADVYEANADYSHGFVVPLVSLYAAYEIRRQYHDEIYPPSWWGMPVVVTGAVILLVGIWYRYALLPGGLGVQSMVGGGLLVVIFGIVLTLGGKALISRFAFPLIYLCFCVPWPERLTSQITVPLRGIVSNFAAVIVRAFGVPIFQDGNMMHLTVTTLGVADACSGIRSLWVMLATAVAFGYFLRCGLVRGLILFVLAIPLAVFFNITRVVSTVLLVIWFGPHFAQGTRHELTGAVVFLAGVITLVAIGWFLAHGRQKRGGGDGNPQPLMAPPGQPHEWRTVRYRLVGILGIILIGGGVIQPVVANHYVRHMPLAARKPLKDLPPRIGAYTEAGKGDFVAAQLDLLRPTDQLNRTYRTERGALLNLWSLYWEPYRGKKSAWNLGPHKPDGCYPAAGWQRIPTSVEKLTEIIPGRNVKVSLFSKEGKSRLVLYFTSDDDTAGGLTVFPRTAEGLFRRMLDSWRAPDVERGAQYIVTVEVDVTSDYLKTLKDAGDFIKEIAPILPEYGINILTPTAKSSINASLAQICA